MFTIAGPIPAMAQLVELPHPQFGDAENITDTVSLKRAIDGTPYTYVKRRNRNKFLWTFRLSRPKQLEIFEFYRLYGSKKLQIVDHKDRVLEGKITNNPIEASGDARSGPAVQNWPRGEIYTVTIEFEGAEV